MPNARSILHVGLTGGIASGKTTVARILAEHGAFVLHADELAHEVMEPGGPAYTWVVEEFGDEILDERGYVNRAVLGQRVFHDARAREALNAIMHPAVRAEYARRLEEYVPLGHAPIAVFDAALLVETGRYAEFHRVVVTSCDREAQVRRLLRRNNLTVKEAWARIESQFPLERKIAHADYVIDTGGTLRQTRAQTDEVYTRLVADFELEFGRPHG
jgi:dephospho-CoA kinase